MSTGFRVQCLGLRGLLASHRGGVEFEFRFLGFTVEGSWFKIFRFRVWDMGCKV